MEVEDNCDTYVVGAYSSVGWSTAIDGDNSCFLFNLTSNLRFEAIKSMKNKSFSCVEDTNENPNDEEDSQKMPSKMTKPAHIPNYRLCMGNTELTIEDDFMVVKSSMSSGSHFAINGDILMKSKARSIIPHLKQFTPCLLYTSDAADE